MDKKQIYSVDSASCAESLCEKSKWKDPEIFILHQGDDEKFLLTMFGKSDYCILSKAEHAKYKAQKGFLRLEERLSDSAPNDPWCDIRNHYAVMFETKGMFHVTKEEAEILTNESYTESFGKTLFEITRSENLAFIDLNIEGEKKRERFLRKDYNLALSVLKQHNKALDKEERKKRASPKVDNTSKFLTLFSKLKSKEK